MKPTFDNLPALTAALVERVAALEALLVSIDSKIQQDEPASHSNQLLRTSEVMKMLQVSKATIYRIPAKVLPYMFMGSDRRYRKKDVEKYINSKFK